MYNRRAIGEGKSFGEMKKKRVICTEYGATVATSYLKAHMERIHGICVPHTRGVDKVGGGPTTYVVSLPRLLQEVKCLVLWFPAVAHSEVQLREHFMYHHFWSRVTVVQEGAEPLHCFDFFGMHMPAGRLINHQRIARCDKNTQIWWRRRDVDIVDNFLEATFSLTGEEKAELI